MIALYILLGILFLLLLPLTARYHFRGEGRLVVRYSGIPIYVYTAESEGQRPKKATKRVKKNGKKKTKGDTVKRMTAQLKEGGAAGALSLLQEGVQFADSTFRRLFRGLRFGRCFIGIVFGGGEAADIALRYGQLAGPIHSARSVLLSLLRIRELELVMTPDFLAETDTVTADIRVSACPLRLLWIALCTALSGMKILLHFSNTQSKDGQNGKEGQ